MRKIMNFGSLNIDKVYGVEDFVQPGETISAKTYSVFCGGKGLNQSIALARAGCPVTHAGKVGPDGIMLLELLKANHVDTRYIRTDGSVSGHAMIQVDKSGQNCIIICGGANLEITSDQVEEALAGLQAGDILLLQNEINQRDSIMERARKKGVRIALNPSPIDDALMSSPIRYADWLILNEIEGQRLCGSAEIGTMASSLARKYPDTAVVLTLGRQGAIYKHGDHECVHGTYEVPVADTTAAGDTFTGYFLACVTLGKTVEEAMELASRASSIAVSRTGASASIPTMAEVLELKLRPAR